WAPSPGMRPLSFGKGGSEPIHVLCLGAHADDIEIGAAGTLLTLLRDRPGSVITWVVTAAPGERASEARQSAEALLSGLGRLDVHLLGLRESYLDRSTDIKEALTAVRDEL